MPVLQSVAPPAVPVTGVTLDSRRVRRGDLYAALPGATTHGAHFAAGAAAAGAAAVLTDPEGEAECRATGLPVDGATGAHRCAASCRPG